MPADACPPRADFLSVSRLWENADADHVGNRGRRRKERAEGAAASARRLLVRFLSGSAREDPACSSGVSEAVPRDQHRRPGAPPAQAFRTGDGGMPEEDLGRQAAAAVRELPTERR